MKPIIDTELEVWLYCLCSEEPIIIYQIIQRFPWFRVIYDDMTEYRSHIEEVLSMFSEALKIMDRNTVQLMIDEQIEQLEQLAEQNEDLAKQNRQLAKRNSHLAEQLEQLKLQKAAVEIKTVEISEKE